MTTTTALARRAAPGGPATLRPPASRSRRLPCRPAASRRLGCARVLAFREEEERPTAPKAPPAAKPRLGSSTGHAGAGNGIHWGSVPLRGPEEAQDEAWREESIREAQIRAAELADRAKAWWAELPVGRGVLPLG
ncbi:hypothetical protein TSOC_005094 [Tetrabaena socialis]|uniref:Uncharacterized protein n=1 Tax=Tetrabaena socialis TaxID=47790 RepID=A0A2J8A788_9CHLO|nr:hypothetical protein TSOC_005094 [Tetrabaena socialis]|eukprot:PNH08394.1 hypothetical protein TSOC_005094 [Tetrabaena socialis]